MWSGPRNISTAMMRSFSSRSDTVVVDEPLYAHYLAETGIDHPGRADILASQPGTWQEVAAQLTAPLPDDARVQYQKHMTHHLLDGIDRGWLEPMTHAYLIRDPAHVIASYAKVRAMPTLEELGFPQQREIYRRFGGPVVDAADILIDPRGMLKQLCMALYIPWDVAMLHWPRGPHPSDGVWAPHWYSAVEKTTCFGPYDARPAEVPPHLRPLLDRAMPYYEELSAVAIRP